MIEKFWKDPVWSAVIAALIIMMGTFLVNKVVLSKHWTIFNSKISSSWQFIFIGSLVSIFGASLILMGLSTINKKIVWEMEGILGMTGLPVKIISLQFHGTNESDDSIGSIEGYARSVNTNEIFPMYLVNNGQAVETSTLQSLPPKQKLIIVIPLLKNTQEMSRGNGFDADNFLSIHGNFEVVLKIDSTEERLMIFRADLLKEINRFKESIPSPKGPIFK